MEKNIYSKDMTLTNFIGKSFYIFNNNIKNILLIILVIYLPVNIILFFAGEQLFASPNFTFSDVTNYIKIIGWLENLIGVIAVLFTILLVKRNIDGAKPDEIKFKDIFKKALSKWGRGAGANILYGIGVGLLLLLFIIPGLIFATYWIFFIYAIAIKDKSYSESFTYSKQIVQGKWWEIFGYGAVTFIATFLIGIALAFIPYVETMVGSIITDSIIDLFYLFCIIIFTLKFINLDENLENNLENDNINNEVKEEDVKKEIEL